MDKIEGISTHVTSILSVISQCDTAVVNHQGGASQQKQIQALINKALLPLGPSLARMGWKRIPVLKVILVPETDTLDNVLKQMQASGEAAIYDFQDRKKVFIQEGNPTIVTNGSTWRKGAIYLAGGSQSLVVKATGVKFTSLTVLGGVRVLTGASVTMDKSVVGHCDVGLHLQGTASIFATDLCVVDCKRQSLSLEGNATATFTDCEITGGATDGLCMEDSSSMVGEGVLISEIQENAVCLRGSSKLCLTKSTLKENPGNHCLVAADASLVLSRCVVDRGFKNTGAGVIQIRDEP